MGFLSTVFLVWCVWYLWAWRRARRAQKRQQKIEAQEQKRQDNMMREYEAKKKREMDALGLSEIPAYRRRIPFDKVLRWEGEQVLRLVYSPVLDELEIKVEFSIASKKGGRVNKGAQVDVWVSHHLYGHAEVFAPMDGVWCPVAEDGSRLAPGDVVLELDATQEALKLWEDLQEKEKAERRRQAAEREKEEIARALKERQRKRELEKQVRQELIDSGELFGDQTKRPPIPREVADAVYSRDQGRCVYCGSTENLQFDHIIPFSKGGATSLENLQLLCQKCNLEKSNKIG